MKRTFTKTGMMILMCLTVFAFNGCKKGDKGDTGPQGLAGAAGPDATTYNFSLTFHAGDTYQTYSGITGFQTNDVVVTYVLYAHQGTEGFWTQLPVVFENTISYIPEFGDTSGLLYINTLKADGTAGSPWSVTVTTAFKAVLIKGKALLSHPGIQFQSYETVKETFNLK